MTEPTAAPGSTGRSGVAGNLGVAGDAGNEAGPDGGRSDGSGLGAQNAPRDAGLRGVAGRLLAFDVDGTILDGQGKLADRTVAAIDAAAAAGAVCTLATGRDWSGVAAILDRVRGLTHALCVNGIEIFTADGGELHAMELPFEAALEAVAILREVLPDVAIGAGLQGELVGEPGVMNLMEEGMGSMRVVDDIVPELRPGVRDLVLWHPTLSNELDRFHVVCSEALHVPGIDVSYTGMPMIEIVPEGCGKDTGLAWLADHLGIARADVVAFGDGLNDLAMLRWAGHGVAMGQARAEVHAVADEITASNDGHGVAAWIEARL